MRLRAGILLAIVASLWWLIGRPGAAALAAAVGLSESHAAPARAPAGDLAPASDPAIWPVVVLSPGNGWWSASAGAVDAGDTGGGLVEKDVTLDLAQQTQALLARCPVQVALARSGDDPDHALASVHEVVNALQPDLALAIHTRSYDAPSGVVAWQTVGGWDDAGSQRLAELAAMAVSTWLDVPRAGPLPETASDTGGGLYIHPWQAPAALVEVGSLGADNEALRNQTRTYARALAEAVLNDLGLPLDCAASAPAAGWMVAVAFPSEAVSTDLTLTNDGLVTWQPGQVWLAAAGEAYGAAAAYALPAAVAPGETATWALPARAPDDAGIYEQRWQLVTGDPSAPRALGEPVSISVVVVPEQAQALKTKLEQKIAEVKAAGAAKADELLDELKAEVKTWAMAEAERQATRCVGLNSGVVVLAIGLAVTGGRKRRGEQ
ncbi:MAG: N-acetylmuramoyl-L-alanine amidase [Anaerolineales bacterium]|nr:N-acetylmuramoyl-L-alanine amidase [Anaerolineales bacterium]